MLIRYPDTEQFRHVLRNVTYKAQFKGLNESGEPIMDRLAKLPTLTFEGTTKIHGSSLSIRIEGEKVTCQSRNNEISIHNDCYGFAWFISTLPLEVFEKFKSVFGDNIVIFGEYAGKGIQDTVAVSQLEKFWTVFALKKIVDEDTWLSLKDVDLTDLNKYKIYSIRQFGVETIEIDFENPANSINKLNELTLLVEKECPVGKFFGVSGCGEGRVWVALSPEYNSSKFKFKIKGSEHSKSKVTKLANVDVEKMKNIEEFVNKYLDEGRLQQGIEFLKLSNWPVDETSTGNYLRWIVKDIQKEEGDTIKSSNLDEKSVNSLLSKKARNWFFNKLRSI